MQPAPAGRLNNTCGNTAAVLLFALAFVPGCGDLAPAPALSLAEECRLGAWLALHVAKEAPPLGVPSPDKPDQGDTCAECGGTGKLGDGTVFVRCGACNGTGRKPAAAFDGPETRDAFEGMELKAEAVERARQLDAAAAAAAKAATPAKPPPAAAPPPTPVAVEAQAVPAPALPYTPERYAVPPRDGRTYRKVCRNGSCAWEPL